MSFEEELFKGYTSHEKQLDKWCEQLSSILGNVTQCMIAEYDSFGTGIALHNRPDYGEEYIKAKGYLFDADISYSTNFNQKLSMISSEKGEFDLNIPYPALDVQYAILYKVRVNENIQRTYGFASNSSKIHNNFANNIDLFRSFLKHFIKENEAILEKEKENRLNFSEVKENYFIKGDDVNLTDRDKINYFLRNVGLLDKDQNITPREWDCLQLQKNGYSASKTGEVLGISNRTVESHFVSIKDKLKLKKKNDINEIIK